VFMYALLGLPAADLLVFGRLGVFVESGGELSQKGLRVMGAFRDAGRAKQGDGDGSACLVCLGQIGREVLLCTVVARGRKQWHVVGCMYGQ
jgi:hypothetical protein